MNYISKKIFWKNLTTFFFRFWSFFGKLVHDSQWQVHLRRSNIYSKVCFMVLPQIGKNIGIEKHTGKVRKLHCFLLRFPTSNSIVKINGYTHTHHTFKFWNFFYKQRIFSNFSCMFLNPNNFSNLNFNCPNLSSLRNPQE